mmetsp:Transcript_28981/g.86523  ORF Transcript_28981/g.86523 Transcript_28981/m.86523 type:complete len:210 (+) Transcript_28981:197-826(+)
MDTACERLSESSLSISTEVPQAASSSVVRPLASRPNTKAVRFLIGASAGSASDRNACRRHAPRRRQKATAASASASASTRVACSDVRSASTSRPAGMAYLRSYVASASLSYSGATSRRRPTSKHAQSRSTPPTFDAYCGPTRTTSTRPRRSAAAADSSARTRRILFTCSSAPRALITCSAAPRHSGPGLAAAQSEPQRSLFIGWHLGRA